MSDKRTEIEKERKFLLKKLPELNYDKILFITQFYIDGWRYRSERDINNTGETKYYKLKKESLGIGINQEVNIQEIDLIDFLKAKAEMQESDNQISKIRRIYNYKGKKFEIDSFIKLTLIMMEIEGVDMSDIIEFPPEVEDVLLIEVTGNKNFNNFNLAK